MDEYAKLIQASVDANNAWSAKQAQAQMDFQERMSNTAHQREVADLKAAGLNPVLSARLGGASTPSGAMGSTDTSGTSALVDLMMMAMQTANSAAGAAQSALEGEGLFGLPLIKNPRQAWQLAYNFLISDEKAKEFWSDPAKGFSDLWNSIRSGWNSAKSVFYEDTSGHGSYGSSGRGSRHNGKTGSWLSNWWNSIFKK